MAEPTPRPTSAPFPDPADPPTQRVPVPDDPQGIASASRSCLVLLGLLAALLLILCVTLSVRAVF